MLIMALRRASGDPSAGRFLDIPEASESGSGADDPISRRISRIRREIGGEKDGHRPRYDRGIRR